MERIERQFRYWQYGSLFVALVSGIVCASLSWNVHKAGFASAADPRYVVEPQRQRLAAR
jgi:hypothetical protein